MKFKTVLADPPWDYKNKATRSAAAKNYPTMTDEELQALPVVELIDENAHLYLWSPVDHLRESLALLKAWGFCIGIGTEVLTRDLRYVPAETLEVGDKLLAFDEFPTRATKEWRGRRYFKTANVTATGIANLHCYDIYLETGEVLRSSIEHPWLLSTSKVSNDGIRWIKTVDIPRHINHWNRRHPMVVNRIIPKAKTLRTYEAGFLSAAFDGEGHLRSRKPHLDFAQKPNALNETVKSFLLHLNYKFTEDKKYNTIRLRGGHFGSLRFLMEMRPPRLLERWKNIVQIEKISIYNTEKVEITKVEDVGIQSVVTLQTDTGTYIAEGFGAHNTYKTMIAWIKYTKHGKQHFGMGNYFRGAWEACLFGVHGKMRTLTKNTRNTLHLRRPLLHSAKPLKMYKLIENNSPPPRIELFARIAYPGWTAIGRDVDGKDIRDAMDILINYQSKEDLKGKILNVTQ